MKLVDHKVILVLYPESFILPPIGFRRDAERADKTACAFRIAPQVRISGRRDVFVIGRVIHDFRIWVVHFLGVVSLSEIVLEKVLLAFFSRSECVPPHSLLVITLHRIFFRTLEAVEVADEVAPVVSLAPGVLVIEDKGDAAVSVVVDTVLHAGRCTFIDYRIGNESVLAVIDLDEKVLGLLRSVGAAHHDSDSVHRGVP